MPTKLHSPSITKNPTVLSKFKFSGGSGEGVTPVPIPNTAVKPLSADGTARAQCVGE